MPSIFDLPGYLVVGTVLLIVVGWSVVWKGLALWHAARNGQKAWFVAILIVHTLGILEIIYLVAAAPNKPLARKSATH